MNILDQISNKFSVDVKQAPATKDEINELKSFSCIEIPDDYLELVCIATEVEIKVNNKKYIRIWGPKGCIEMNEAYNIQNFIPDSLAIGDDEGGNALIYANGKEGFGIYTAGFGDLDIDDALYIASSLSTLLINDFGIDNL